MAVYYIFQVNVTDESWLPEYASKVHDIAAKHGGKYLSRSGNITAVEGDPASADVVAIIEFPSIEAGQAWYGDPEYAPFLKARLAGTNGTCFVVDDADATGAIPYLPKG